MKVTLKLSPEEVRTVIWNYVHKDLGHEPLTAPEFKVEEVLHGCMEDHKTLEFMGAEIDVDMPGPVRAEDEG